LYSQSVSTRLDLCREDPTPGCCEWILIRSIRALLCYGDRFVETTQFDWESMILGCLALCVCLSKLYGICRGLGILLWKFHNSCCWTYTYVILVWDFLVTWSNKLATTSCMWYCLLQCNCDFTFSQVGDGAQLQSSAFLQQHCMRFFCCCLVTILLNMDCTLVNGWLWKKSIIRCKWRDVLLYDLCEDDYSEFCGVPTTASVSPNILTWESWFQISLCRV
jgi:hypothetical protein